MADKKQGSSMSGKQAKVVYKQKSSGKKTGWKISFSQKLYLFNMLFVVIVCVVSFVLIGMSGVLGIPDVSPISTIVVAAFAELATHTGFYIWKAKYENGRKYKDVNLMQELASQEIVNSIADRLQT